MMAAALTRLIRRGNKPATGFLRPLATSPPPPPPPQHRSRACLIDTFALASSLRAQGLPSRHADVIVSTIFKVLEVASENADQSFARKEDLETMKELRDLHLSKLKFEVEESLKVHISTLQHENAKRHGELEDKILKFHHDVEMKINEVKYDCISKCAKARDDAMKFCIGTFLIVFVATTVLKVVVG